MQGQYNMRSPAVKRLMREAQELSEPTEQYHAHPLEDNLFEWHFTIRGPEDTEFEGGIYHGRIVLPADYPMKPPSIILLTPNGRFETFKKICLSISGHHPESWQPSWSIRTALLAIIGFMPTHGNGAIGSLDYTPDERKVLARRTKDFKCEQCGEIKCILKPVTEASEKTNQEAKELAKQISFQGEKEKKGSKSSESTDDTSSAPEPISMPSSAPTQSTTAPSQLPQQRFPMMPMGFPPFTPAMFRPPTTNSAGMPPQMMMPPPFWPGMMPPTTQHQGRMPFLPGFPPSYMMPPGAMSTQQTSTSKITTSSVKSTSCDSVQQQSSTSANLTTSVPTTTSISSVNNETETRSETVQRESTSSASSSEPQKQSSVDSANDASSSSKTTPEPQVRRRVVGEPSSGQAPTTQAELNSAAAARLAAFAARLPQPSAGANAPSASRQRIATPFRQRVERSTDGWHQCTILLMVVIAIALVMLIMRRLIMMKVINFDYSYS